MNIELNDQQVQFLQDILEDMADGAELYSKKYQELAAQIISKINEK